MLITDTLINHSLQEKQDVSSGEHRARAAGLSGAVSSLQRQGDDQNDSGTRQPWLRELEVTRPAVLSPYERVEGPTWQAHSPLPSSYRTSPTPHNSDKVSTRHNVYTQLVLAHRGPSHQGRSLRWDGLQSLTVAGRSVALPLRKVEKQWLERFDWHLKNPRLSYISCASTYFMDRWGFWCVCVGGWGRREHVFFLSSLFPHEVLTSKINSNFSLCLKKKKKFHNFNATLGEGSYNLFSDIFMCKKTWN